MLTAADASQALAHNRALVHQLAKIVDEGNLDAVREVASGQIASEAERWIGPFRQAFPDFRMDVLDVVAEADKVVAHFNCSGTHKGEWLGHPATGRRFQDVHEIYIFRVEHGKLDSALAVVEDNLARMRQLGLVG